MPSSYVQVRCSGCGMFYRTRQRGAATRCPVRRGGCGQARWVRMDQAWEGPGAPELAVPVLSPVHCKCRHCGREWASRAAESNAVACPGCGKRHRIRLGARVVQSKVPRRRAVRVRPDRIAPRRPDPPAPVFRMPVWPLPLQQEPARVPPEPLRAVAPPATAPSVAPSPVYGAGASPQAQGRLVCEVGRCGQRAAYRADVSVGGRTVDAVLCGDHLAERQMTGRIGAVRAW